MRPPVPISTLADAAKWMSELSGTTMTEREVLGLAFNYQWTAERAWRIGDAPGELTKGDPGDALPDITAERIIQVLIPVDVEMRLRTWRIDGFTDRPVPREQRIVALDIYELFDLLTYECAEVTLPRPTDLGEADENPEYTERVLAGAVVTLSSVRIYACGLHLLWGWWKSIIRPQLVPPAGQPQHLPKQRRQEQAILHWLSANGVAPKSLPEPQSGRPGVKHAAWCCLQMDRSVFQSRKTFDLAWERLRSAGELRNAK